MMLALMLSKNAVASSLLMFRYGSTSIISMHKSSPSSSMLSCVRWISGSILQRATGGASRGGSRVSSSGRIRKQLNNGRIKPQELPKVAEALNAESNIVSQSILAKDIPNDYRIVYIGSLRDGMKRLKTFSIICAFVGALAAPIFGFVHAEDKHLFSKMIFTCAVAFIGAGTTLILQWVLGPYITKIFVSPNNTHVVIERLTLFAKFRCRAFGAGDIRPYHGIRPFINLTNVSGTEPMIIDKDMLLDTELSKAWFKGASKKF